MLNQLTIHTLLGFSGVAATFAGFSGVVVIFGERALGRWSPEEHYRLVNMIVLSLAVCFFSVLPLVLAISNVPEPSLWRRSSFVAGIAYTAYYPWVMNQVYKTIHFRLRSFKSWVSTVLLAGGAVATILQFLSAFNYIVGGPGPYVIGLLILLIVAGVQFAFLVLTPL